MTGNLVGKKGKRKVQGVPQSQTAALPRHKEEEETDKTNRLVEKKTQIIRESCRSKEAEIIRKYRAICRSKIAKINPIRILAGRHLGKKKKKKKKTNYFALLFLN